MSQALKISCGEESLDKAIMTKIIFQASGGFWKCVLQHIWIVFIYFSVGGGGIAYLTHNSLCGVDGWGVGCGDEG